MKIIIEVKQLDVGKTITVEGDNIAMSQVGLAANHQVKSHVASALAVNAEGSMAPLKAAVKPKQKPKPKGKAIKKGGWPKGMPRKAPQAATEEGKSQSMSTSELNDILSK